MPSPRSSTAGDRPSAPATDAPRVSYAFNLWNNHYHLSLLYTALAKLSAGGAIDLDWRVGELGELDSTSTGGMVSRLLIESGGRQDRVAIDLFDRSDVFDGESLRWCDRYLKRSLYRPDVDAHAGPEGAKVELFGMNYACRSAEADRLVVRSVAQQAWRLGLRSPLTALRRTLGERNTYRTYWSLQQVEDFEAPPEAPRKPRVLFQTRVWEPEEVGPDSAEEINTQRADTVRLLRNELGNRFLGGLVPTEYARKHYPDLITTAPTKRRDFIQLVKTSQVLVYTRGLHHSIAFKLPEYLAASGVVVSDPIRNELPAGRGDEAAVDTCLDPLAIAEKASALLNHACSVQSRSENWRFYHSHVAPESMIGVFLEPLQAQRPRKRAGQACRESIG